MLQLYPYEYGVLPSGLSLDTLGKDYHDEYRYGVEHHTIDLWMRLWQQHDHAVRTKGCLPPLQDIVIFTYLTLEQMYE